MPALQLGASSNPSYLMPRQLGETLAMWAIWLALLVISWLHKLQNITARISSSCHNSSHELFHIINPVMFFFRIRRAPTKVFAGYTKSGGCVGLMTRTSRCENLEGLSHQYSWERTNQSEVKPPSWMRIRLCDWSVPYLHTKSRTLFGCGL